MYKILIVEDDTVISQSIESHLSKWDYKICTAVDFRDILKLFIEFQPHLVLLDITLPFMNGYHWCSEIRRLSSVPIIFISSASDNMNIVMAMNMGADDFISKPFDLNVLTAKTASLLRRAYSFSADASIIEHKGVVLNLGSAELTYNSQNLELTKNELRILQILFENNGKIVSRDAIMLKLWSSDSFIDDNTLTVNVTRLRKKLEKLGLYDYIKTKKNLGYMVD